MKMDDEGSLMIEMSLITPVLIGVVFVVINLFVIVMNYSVAAGEAYTVLYNREEYILLGGADDTQTAESVIRTNVEEKTTFAGQVEARSYMTDTGAIEHGAMASAVLGICVNEVSYTERSPGIGQFVDENKKSKKVETMREIRNTGNNLRRWQSYGKLLSE